MSENNQPLQSFTNKFYEPKCKACNFSGHEDYDVKCISGKLSNSAYAKIVGCSRPAIGTHLCNHVPEEIAQGSALDVEARARRLDCRFEEGIKEILEMKDAARQDGNLELALKAFDRLFKAYSHDERVIGIGQDQPPISVQINVLQSPEWIAHESRVIMALDRFPEAKRAVVVALHGA